MRIVCHLGRELLVSQILQGLKMVQKRTKVEMTDKMKAAQDNLENLRTANLLESETFVQFDRP